MANLPMAATSDGNEKPIDSMRVEANCHHCHYFSESKRVPTSGGFHILLAIVATLRHSLDPRGAAEIGPSLAYPLTEIGIADSQHPTNVIL